MAQLHELKCDPVPFQDVWATRKTFELRKNDRGFECGDVLKLRETVPGYPDSYTGRSLLALVVHMLREGYGLPEGYVAMSIKTLARLPVKETAAERADAEE